MENNASKPILNEIRISSGIESIGLMWVSSGDTLTDLDHAIHTLSTMREVLTRVAKDNE